MRFTVQQQLNQQSLMVLRAVEKSRCLQCSHALSVTQISQHDASYVPQISYADAVKRGRLSDVPCAAGPSHADSVSIL